MKFFGRHMTFTFVLILMLAIPAGYAASNAYSHHSHGKDTGVAACEKIVKNDIAVDTPDQDGPMTDAQYNKAISPFKNSNYSDIKNAGINLVDVVYRSDKMTVDVNDKDKDTTQQLSNAIETIGALEAKWSDLQIACRNHGVNIPNLPAT